MSAPPSGSNSKVPESLTYASAGVSIDAGNTFVSRIKASVASTARPGADAQIGGFGGELDLSQAGYSSSAPPILVGAIDGVGTKLMIAQAVGDHHGVGIDLVAMNVNDLVVQGAEPLMFLDYYGCSRLDQENATRFVEGVAAGCRLAGCALVGGETAEMPGMYKDKDYDAAGAAVGAVLRPNRLPRLDDMAEGDVLLGLKSSGVHSNGFSLVRRIVDAAGLAYSDPAPWIAEDDQDGKKATAGESLLTPTRIYVRALLPLIKEKVIKGMAHITGGGLVDNVPRMLPAHLSGEIDIAAWEVPRVFRWLRREGNVEPLEMCRTFNNGIGMVLVVAKEDADRVEAGLKDEGVVRIGKLVARKEGSEGCELLNLSAAAWEL